MGQLVLGLLHFLGFLVVGGEQLLVFFFQLGVGYVGEAGDGLVAGGFVVHWATVLGGYISCFSPFVVSIQVYWL